MTQPVPVPEPPAEPTSSTTAPANPATHALDQDKPLGPAGERALAAEREARKALEKKFAPLEHFLAALSDGDKPKDGKSEVQLLEERFADHERTLAEERTARWRAEVAHEKGLTPQQAARLVGGSREELTADADQLLTLFPAASAGPRTPAPDPSQGARGGTPGPDLEAQIAEAHKSGDWRRVAALQKSKLANLTN
jgi:hypothetical protein